MPNWFDIAYLADGTDRQQAAYHALQASQVMTHLADYQPVLVGTVPINIDIASSDLDILCYATDLTRFQAHVRQHYYAYDNFRDKQRDKEGIVSYIANFTAHNFLFEIFAQAIPVTQQRAYRHMLIEHRLLQLGNASAREAIRQLKRDGLKTEPAFAQYFNITGDNPYDALLTIAELDDDKIRKVIKGVTG